MLYPNKAQWWVIWIVAVLAFLFLVNGAVEVALGLVALGCLLVWQLSRLRKRPEERETDVDENSRAEHSESAYCVESGAQLESTWKRCPFCGNAKY